MTVYVFTLKIIRDEYSISIQQDERYKNQHLFRRDKIKT